MSKNKKEDYIFRGDIKGFDKLVGSIIGVDWFDFRDMKSQYFLSHAHNDHFNFQDFHNKPRIIGLFAFEFDRALKKRPHTKIHCTATTWEIIKRLPICGTIAKDHENFETLNNHIVIVEPDIKNSIPIELLDENGNLSGEVIDVTVIPANHIPGAVMFLFEDKKNKKRALYTGDFRYDVREKNDEMNALKKFVENYDEVIDYLYVDITCLDLGRLYHPDQNKLPSRQESKDMVCNLIRRENPESVTVHIDAELLGAEDMVKAVAEFLNNSSDSIVERLEDDCRRKDLYRFMLKDIPSEEATGDTVLHISDKGIIDCNSVCRKCEEDKDTLKIRATLFWLIYINKYSYSKPDTWTNKRDNSYWQVLYSHHSSDYELREFISHLKFKEVFPINEPFARKNLEGITYESDQTVRVEERLRYIEKALYFTFDCPSLTYESLVKVIWFRGYKKPHSDDIDRRLNIDKFELYMRNFPDNVSDMIQAEAPARFVVIPCNCEAELFSKVDEVIDTMGEKIGKDQRTAVLFYSSVVNNNKWKDKIDQNRSGTNYEIFYINLTDVPEYTESDIHPLDLGILIIIETLKNLIRNEDKKVDVTDSDWPMPYEFSERKREYGITSQMNGLQIQ